MHSDHVDTATPAMFALTDSLIVRLLDEMRAQVADHDAAALTDDGDIAAADSYGRALGILWTVEQLTGATTDEVATHTGINF